MAKRPHVLGVVLAGGEGKRLWPLTRDRAKPAVPFGANYRIIDFALSNLVNGRYLRIAVLTQYKSHSLDRHIAQTWRMSPLFNNFVMTVPAQMRLGPRWFEGSADAIFQNLNLIQDENPDYICVFGADHIYRMDIGEMIAEHVEAGADISISVVPQPIEEAHQLGCVEVDEKMRVRRFLEKPSSPPAFPGDPGKSLVSMGNYLFNYDVLCKVLEADHADSKSRHDLGGDVFPRWYDKLHIHAYNFMNNRVPGTRDSEIGYWRDVGTIGAYWRASMDLVSVTPAFNMYNEDWPILTARVDDPPAKFVFADRESNRMGIATDSLVPNGCIISGGHIDRCILGPRVRINSYSTVSESVLFEGVEVGRHCRIRRVIVDKRVKIPANTVIGYDPESDRARKIVVSPEGISVVSTDVVFDPS